MLNKVKDFFSGKTSLDIDKSGAPTSKDLQIASAVLLLEMAGADDDYAPEEVKACFSVLEQQFGIEDEETIAIFESAEQARQDKGKIDEFVAAINENFNDKQKQLLMAMVWRVIVADEVVENFEKRFATQLRTRLQLSREQAEESKNLALDGAL